MKVLVFGNANADIAVKPVGSADPSVIRTFVDHIGLTSGGNGMTAAFVLKKLGIDCALATRLGGPDDHFSNFLAERMQEAGLDTSLVERNAGMSCGTVIVLVDEKGNRRFLYKRGVQEVMDLTQNVLDSVPEFDAVSIHGTFLMPAFDGEGTLRLLKKAKEAGKMTFMDVSYDNSGRWLELIGKALPYCDYFMPSEIEAEAMTGMSDPLKMARELFRSGPDTVIIKLGEKGCCYKTAGGEGMIPAFPITPVDTTGAGDCFCAGFIYAVCRDYPLPEALKFANAAGACSCENFGAAGNIGSLADIQSFLSRF